MNNKRAYLSTILDLYDKKVVAYKVSKFNNVQLVMDTINEVIKKEKIFTRPWFQYTSFETNPFTNLSKSK
ncbi:MAG: hypothetical protein PHI76_03675 [Clostridia bacterium]|nr:hypothetical protein [Clostridia bacterium]